MNEADSAIELVDVKVDSMGATDYDQSTNHNIESDSCLSKSETKTEKEVWKIKMWELIKCG